MPGDAADGGAGNWGDGGPARGKEGLAECSGEHCGGCECAFEGTMAGALVMRGLEVDGGGWENVD